MLTERTISLISLIGLPGVGKSTIGRQLAKRLGWKFVDSDAVIEKRIDCSILDYFNCEGEGRFRDIESEVLMQLMVEHKTILATGGGAVLREANRAALRQNSHVVYLRSTPEELFRRLRNDTQRPLLQVEDPQARLREIYGERDPLYRETAHFIVETGRPPAASLVNTVLMQLELSGVLDSDTGSSTIKPPLP